MKRKVYCLMGAAFVLVCGCGKTQDTSVDMQKATAAEYQEADNLADEFEIQSVNLPIKEENLGFYCVSDGKIFYVVDYSDSLQDQTGTGENVEFENKYNTQIHMYDMNQKEDQLVYQYDLDYCMSIYDLRARGDRIVWIEQPKSGGWIMKTMDTGDEIQPQSITDSTEMSSDENDAVVPTMSEDKAYWYQCKKEKKHSYSLYSYDFLTQKIQCEQTDLDVESPYEGFSLVSSVGTLLEKENDVHSLIHLWNVKNAKKAQLHIDGEVSAPISNESLSVWMKNYETDGTLYIYDWYAAEIGKIDFNPGRFFSYGIIGDNVFVNQRDQSAYGSDGLICFDVKKKEYQQIMETDQMLTIFQGDDDEIYTSVVEDGVVTIITVTMRDEKSGA